MINSPNDDHNYADGQDVVYSADRIVPESLEKTSSGSGRSHLGRDGSGGSHSGSGTVPCFVSGTLIETETGPMPVEAIIPGARIITRDHGLQPVLWAGSQSYSSAQIGRSAGLQPICIAAHSFGPDAPAQPLFLSPQHRILLNGPEISLHFGTDEVLASVVALTNNGSILNDHRARPVTYHHLLFERHQIILANNLWCESFFPGDMALSAISPKARVEIAALLGPGLRLMKTARLCLKPFEARLVADQIAPPVAKAAKAA